MIRIALGLFLVATSASAQSGFPVPQETLYPFVTPQLLASPEALATSEAGSFGDSSDPLVFMRNPAVLGGFADRVAFSGGLIDWIADIGIQSFAVAGGARDVLPNVSVGLGLAYGATTFSQIPTTTVDPTELDDVRDDALSLGLAAQFNGPVRVRGGVSGRHLRSIPASFVMEEGTTETDRASATALDLGVDVTAPIGRWIQPEPTASGFQFALDASVGYALRGVHLSSSPYASLPDTEVRPERVPTAGARFSVGIDAFVQTTPVRVLEAAFVAEAEDAGETLWGDLGAGAVLLGIGTEEGVVGRRGTRLVLGETLTLASGRLEGGSFVGRRTAGVTASVGGALRLGAVMFDRPALYSIGRRFDLRLSYARMEFREAFGDTHTLGLGLAYRP